MGGVHGAAGESGAAAVADRLRVAAVFEHGGAVPGDFEVVASLRDAESGRGATGLLGIVPRCGPVSRPGHSWRPKVALRVRGSTGDLRSGQVAWSGDQATTVDSGHLQTIPVVCRRFRSFANDSGRL